VAALASLETIEKDGLLARSTAIGKRFEERARAWQQKFSPGRQRALASAACARSKLVSNRETREPAGAQTKELSRYA